MSNWYREHLDTVSESYFEHMGHAFSFGYRMFKAAICVSLHGLLPFVFTKTGKACVAELHDEMVVNRVGLTARKQVLDQQK